VWQRYNHFHRSVRGSQSGFALLTPIMETYDGPAWRLIATSFVFSPKHRGALDRLPFQGFARLGLFGLSPRVGDPSRHGHGHGRRLGLRESRSRSPTVRKPWPDSESEFMCVCLLLTLIVKSNELKITRVIMQKN
jgi:hypothetical protein